MVEASCTVVDSIFWGCHVAFPPDAEQIRLTLHLCSPLPDTAAVALPYLQYRCKLKNTEESLRAEERVCSTLKDQLREANAAGEATRKVTEKRGGKSKFSMYGDDLFLQKYLIFMGRYLVLCGFCTPSTLLDLIAIAS